MVVRIVMWIALLAGVAEAKPKPKPCPKDLAKQLVPLYGERAPSADEIQITACVWGTFAGAGWFVEHVIPWGPDSKAESEPDGGYVFLTEDRKIVASLQQHGLDHVTAARAIDLDGDGVDEAVVQFTWSDFSAPWNGEKLVAVRVKGKDFVDTSIDVSRTDESGSCLGKVAFTRAGAATHIAITSKRRGKASDCAKTREYKLAGDSLEQLP